MARAPSPRPGAQTGKDDEDDEQDYADRDGAAEGLEDGTHALSPCSFDGFRSKKV
jgi:hypothetical protein